MEITVADERALVLTDQLKFDEAQSIAEKRKADAFGAFQKVTSFLSRPKDNDFEITYTEHRYEPFWHVTGSARYVYNRTVQHHWPTSGPEVIKLTIDGKEYSTTNDTITVSALEDCVQEESEELFVDGLTSAKQSTLKDYLKFSAKELKKEDIEALSKKSVVLPPVARASVLVRDAASKMMHSIEADKIFEESVQFQHVDLYYRPVFAFRYKWISKAKEAVVEVDGLTGNVTFSQKSFPQLVGKVLEYDFLFDIGADAVGMFVPGGSIAVKFAKKAIDIAKQKR